MFIKTEQSVPADTFLIIPETAKNRDMPTTGEVFAIGGRRITKKGLIVEHDFRVGDRVLFKKFTGLWIDFRGHRFIQISQGDIEAILE